MRKMKASLLLLFVSVTAMSMLYGKVAYSEEEDVLKPRVPADKLPLAKALKSNVKADEKAVHEGKEIFMGKGACFSCHGESGKGDGPVGESFNPRPRNFTDTRWQGVRTDGEIFWAISNGTELGMIPYGDNLNEEERWQLVSYIRELGKSVKK